MPSFFLRHNPQHQSLFVSKLPPELRHQIYQTILGGQTFHIWRLYGGFSKRGLCRRHCANTTRRQLRIIRGCPCNYRKDSTVFNYPLSALPFLQTCRKIYSEAVEVLYTENIFEVLEHASIDHDLRTAMPLHRFHSIRSLRLGRHLYDWSPGTHGTSENALDRDFWPLWEQIWAVVASMEGLVTLEVDIYYHPPQTILKLWGANLWEEKILEPLWMVKRPKKWDVNVNWQDTGLEVNGAPFNLVRRA